MSKSPKKGPRTSPTATSPTSPQMSGSSTGSEFIVLSRPPSNYSFPSNMSNINQTQHSPNREDLSLVENDELVNFFRVLKQENVSLTARLNDTNSLLSRQSDELLKIRETQRETIRQHLTKYDQAKTEILELRKTNQILEQTVKEQQEKMEEELQALKHQDEAGKVQLQSRIAELEAIKTQLHAKTVEMEDTIKTLAGQTEDMKKALDEKNSEIDQILSSRNSHSEAPMTSDVELYRSQIQQLTEDCKLIQEIKSQLKADNEELNAKVEMLESAVQQSRVDVQKMREAAHRVDVEKQDLLAMNNELQSKLAEYQMSGSPPESGFNNFRELESSVGKQLQDEYCMVVRDEKQQAVVASSTRDNTNTEGACAGSERRQRAGSDISSSKKKATSEHTVRDLLVQLQSERQKVDEYMNLLRDEQNMRKELADKLVVAQQQLQANTNTLDTRVSQLKQEHQETVNKLLQQIDETSAQVQSAHEKQDHTSLQSAGEDIQGLKSQVLSLVKELQDTEEKLKTAKERVKSYRHRMTEAERQVLILTEEYEARCEKDSSTINSQRIELQNYEETLKAERQATQQERTNMKEIRTQHSRLIAEYETLWKVHNDFRDKGGQGGADPRIVQEKDAKIDNLTAQLVSADEAIAAKEDETRELRRKLMELQGDLETIPVLKAQADIFQADFQAEREAREKAHGEKEIMMQEIQQLQADNQQLQDELNTYTNTQIAEMQRRHGGYNRAEVRTGFQQPGRGYPYPARYYVDGEEGNERQGRNDRVVGVADGMGGPGHQDENRMQPVLIARQAQGGSNERAASQATEFTCPKCEQSYPDMDTLQIHILECID